MGLTNSVPESVSLADSSEDSQFATLAYLLADKSLSFCRCGVQRLRLPCSIILLNIN